tara:strand:+ start:782 stop:1354 length:573 start_codon:yes stop_codon:yes gene_type:complete
MKLFPGDKIAYTVYYLEMAAQPDFDFPKNPPEGTFVLNSKNPSLRYFFDLYGAVGADYEWTDKYEVSSGKMNEFLSNPDVNMFSFFKDGWTAGFFVLDKRKEHKQGVCDLAYFGLVPEAIGYGYGEYLLKFAVKQSWEDKNLKLLTVNTNTLDHRNALPLYKKIGFKIVKTETETRILSKSKIINRNGND